MKKLTICIVSYNVKELLKRCIESIVNHGKHIDYEIIVVDNNSSDGSTELVLKNYKEINVIINAENKGYARAVNQAVNEAKGEFILILNSDTQILPQTLDRALHFMKRQKDAGILGCLLVNPDGSLQPSCRSFPSLQNFIFENLFLDKIFYRSQFFGRPYMSYFDFNQTREVDVVLGAFMLLRRSTVEEIGLMDEQFFMYAEETDWCYRAKQRGWKIYFYPGAKIIHYGGESAKQNIHSMFIELHKSHHKFISKYHGNLYLAIVKLVLFLGILLRVVLFSISVVLQSIKINVTEFPQKKLSVFYKTLKWYMGFGE